jgi:hypothetical protein
MPRTLARLRPEPEGWSGGLYSPAGPLAQAIRQTKNWAVDSKAEDLRQAAENYLKFAKLEL